MFLVVAVAAIIGGVLGSRALRASQSEDSGSSTGEPGTAEPFPTSTANSTTKLQSLRQGSPLAVTGWWKDAGVELFLFYQDDNNMIRRSKYNSTDWESSDKYNSFAGRSSHLSGTIIHYSDGYMPQTELFYTNDDKRLLGMSMNGNLNPSYEEDSIKNMLLNTGVNSSVSSYWPWVTFQGPDGGLMEVRNRLRVEFSPAAEWDVKKLGVVAADASHLALVPLSTNFSKIAVKGGYGIIYQAENDQLAALVPDLDSEELARDYAASWPTGFPSIELPQRGVFAAFSVARPSDSLQRVFTYVLYLDASANINVVYTGASSWETSQPAVLMGVDSDTDIACLTMATTYRDSNRSEVFLQEASEVARCYFQKNGLLQEVIFDGNNWLDAVTVPIS